MVGDQLEHVPVIVVTVCPSVPPTPSLLQYLSLAAQFPKQRDASVSYHITIIQ